MGKRTTLQIVGAAAGFLIAGPGGAKYGYIAGGVLGGMIYPPEALGGPASIGALGYTAAQTGQVLPVFYGRTRLPGSILWYHLLDSGGGKKGGASGDDRLMAIALCEGQASSLLRVWAGGDELTLGDLDYSFYTGTGAQAADATMTSYLDVGGGQVPAAYPHVCYFVIAATKEANLTFEVTRNTAAVAAGNPAIAALGLDAFTEDGNGDMNPVVCLADFMTHPRYGLGYAATDLDGPSWREEAGFCAFNNLYVSPILDAAKDGTAHIEHLLTYFDGLIVLTQGVFRLHSRRSPVRTPLWFHNLYDTDWVEPPRFAKPKALEQRTANTVAVEFRDRAVNYDRGLVPLADDWDVAERGVHREALNLPGVTTSVVAGLIASKLLWSRIISPFGVEGKLGPEGAWLEPGELIKVRGNEAYAIADRFVRIITIREEPDRTFVITGMEER